MLDFVVFHGSLLGNNFSEQQTKFRNIPLTLPEVIQEFARSVVGIDFERQIERSARGNDPKILIEHNERLSNRVDDSVRKFPGILDLGELLPEQSTSVLGQTEKNSVRAYVFRFALELGHCSMPSALRICANNGHWPVV